MTPSGTYLDTYSKGKFLIVQEACFQSEAFVTAILLEYEAKTFRIFSFQIKNNDRKDGFMYGY